jgi:hypothetical protein
MALSCPQLDSIGPVAFGGFVDFVAFAFADGDDQH